MAELRAAAYVRVSTSSNAQEHSFEFQDAYWRQEIQSNPQYKFVGVYADKGISGKSMAKRIAFNTLIADCMEDEIDIVFTKSVQRFARKQADTFVQTFLRQSNKNYTDKDRGQKQTVFNR